MAYVSIADRDHEIEHHDPQTFVTKYIYSQDHKVIAIQYGGLAILIGLVGMLLSSMFRLQLGFPIHSISSIPKITCSSYRPTA